MALSKNIAVISKECVACGTCTKHCPKQAITIYKGIIAKVDTKKCVGCGKCAKLCPADVIAIEGRAQLEKTLV